MDKDTWVKKAVAAIDQYSVDRIIDGLRIFFDIKKNTEAMSNAAFLLKGDYFTFALRNKLKAQKRAEELPNLILALQEIDPERYETFKGLKAS